MCSEVKVVRMKKLLSFLVVLMMTAVVSRASVLINGIYYELNSSTMTAEVKGSDNKNNTSI